MTCHEETFAKKLDHKRGVILETCDRCGCSVSAHKPVEQTAHEMLPDNPTEWVQSQRDAYVHGAVFALDTPNALGTVTPSDAAQQYCTRTGAKFTCGEYDAFLRGFFAWANPFTGC